jgi:histidinol phosphatase-like enzyme (inositol monophosphatase family)
MLCAAVTRFGIIKSMAYEREVAVARELAEEAGRIAEEFQKKGITAEEKADESPVTAADRACEALLVEGLQKAFPGDGFLGEEGANRATGNGRRWIIDPIDGTRDFVRGIPLWSVLVGLEEGGQVVAGVACCPGQRVVAWASKGGGTWLNGERVHVSGKPDVRNAVLSFNGFNKVGVDGFSDRLLPWVRKFGAVRGFGGSFDAILLAAGRADVWIEPNAQPWDLAALKILVEEAGGVFGSFTGANSIYDGNAWACTPGLKTYVNALVRAAESGISEVK